MNTRNITRLAGWFLVAASVAHLSGTFWARLPVWAEIASRGLFAAVTFRPAGPTELATAEAFWISLGGCAGPMLIFGAYVVWAAGHNVRVPAGFGWAVISWGAVAVLFLPASPALVFPVIGVLLVVADRLRSRSATASRAVQAGQSAER